MSLSKYTTELRFLIENNFDNGLNSYPIFDESYRKSLNDKIVEHYYFREIGFETAELFKRYLNRTMNEIMPYYNQLYKSQLLNIDPLVSRKLIEQFTKSVDSTAIQEGSGTQTNTATGSNDNKSINSDTPQSNILIGNIEDNLYASSATVDQSTGINNSESVNNSTANSTANSSETYSRDYTGLEGDQSELLLNYRKTFLNIDMLIIDDLNTLFMGIW